MPPAAGDAPILFDVCLQSWPESEQCAMRILLNRVIDDCVINDRMVHNLLAETQFSAADIDALLALLHGLATSDSAVAEICQRVKAFCAKTEDGARRTLRGRPAQTRDAVLGRVLPLSRFVRLLCETGCHTDPDEARATVRAMCDTELVEYLEHWLNYPLGRYAMWSTFDEAGAEPFPHGGSAAELLEHLGLDPEVDGGVLLLFEYRLPPGVVSHVPSFCDAYVAQWNAWFRVSAHEAPFGRTRPVGEREARGAPEVIHDPITALTLVRLSSRA